MLFYVELPIDVQKCLYKWRGRWYSTYERFYFVAHIRSYYMERAGVVYRNLSEHAKEDNNQTSSVPFTLSTLQYDSVHVCIEPSFLTCLLSRCLSLALSLSLRCTDIDRTEEQLSRNANSSIYNQLHINGHKLFCIPKLDSWLYPALKLYVCVYISSW